MTQKDLSRGQYNVKQQQQSVMIKGCKRSYKDILVTDNSVEDNSKRLTGPNPVLANWLE